MSVIINNKWLFVIKLAAAACVGGCQRVGVGYAEWVILFKLEMFTRGSLNDGSLNTEATPVLLGSSLIATLRGSRNKEWNGNRMMS